MAKTLRVQLTQPRTPDLMHKFLNFAEEVSVDASLRDECAISMEEIDGPSGMFHLREIHKRFLRTAASKVRKIAEKHYLLESIQIVEIKDGGAF